MEVNATARMWSWQFEYEDGRRENRLVPTNFNHAGQSAPSVQRT